MKKISLGCILFLLFAQSVLAQEATRLGQKALMGGNFTEAANFFEKAYTENHSDMNALWFLGYSYFHANEYAKCVNAFDKLIALKPSETVAYYYRGKAKTAIYTTLNNNMAAEKEKLIKSTIKDFTIGINLSPNDLKFYQNRGLTYLDLGFYKNQKLPAIYNKAEAEAVAKLALKDFKKVLFYNSNRSDINTLIDKTKQLLVDVEK